MNTYKITGKRRMPIGACTLIATISAPSYREALASLVESFPEVDTLTCTVTVVHRANAKCMKCGTADAVLTLSGNATGYWHYCTECARHAMYGNGDDLGALALRVRYIYPFGGADRSTLPADALALCR